MHRGLITSASSANGASNARKKDKRILHLCRKRRKAVVLEHKERRMGVQDHPFSSVKRGQKSVNLV